MKRILFLLIAFVAIQISAKTYDYVWVDVYPGYQEHIPASDFTLDGLFRIDTDKAGGTTGPQFFSDKKTGLMLRAYANNTIRIQSLNNASITRIVFVVGGNGCSSLAELTPSTGIIDSVYTGKDQYDSFREYRCFWKGSSRDITFTVGAYCEYGYDCLENGKSDVAGTLMTKELIIETSDATDLHPVGSTTETEHAKQIENGQLIIIRDGIRYNVLGSEIR